MELTFYILVIFLSSITLLLNWTSPTFEILVKALGKLIPIFLIVISTIQILAMYNLLEKGIW